jgi:N-acetylglutamate synthase-like GNAT family acetyltransferase
MKVLHVSSGELLPVQIETVNEDDYKLIKKSVHYFDWKHEKEYLILKITVVNENHIIGLISLNEIDEEERIEIRLLAVSKENRGRSKVVDGVAGNLIAFACRQTIKKYGVNGCVSLLPKTLLRQHYKDKYGFIDAGHQLFIEGNPLFQLIKKYEV